MWSRRNIARLATLKPSMTELYWKCEDKGGLEKNRSGSYCGIVFRHFGCRESRVAADEEKQRGDVNKVFRKHSSRAHVEFEMVILELA